MTPMVLDRIGVRGLMPNAVARDQMTPEMGYVMRNVRSYKGKLETSPGVSSYISATVSGRPRRIIGWEMNDGAKRLNVLTNTKIYRINESSGALTDITRATGGDYTGSTVEWWDVVAFNNVMIAVNNRDAPQKWDGSAANCVALGGSPPNGRTIAGFLTYLLIGGATANPQRVSWSDSGAHETWTGGDANNLTLYQGPGPLIRLLPLGEVCMAYRTKSIHMLFYVGPPFIIAQRQLTTEHGLIAPMAVASLGDRHVYWGTDNVYVTDGVTRTPIANDLIDEMMTSFDAAAQDQIHAAVDFWGREVYFLYPEPLQSSIPTAAFVWNYSNGTWRKEDLRATATGNWHKLVAVYWNTASGSWASQTLTWNSSVFASNLPVVLLGTDAGAIRWIDLNVVDVITTGRTRRYESGLFDAARLLSAQDPRFKPGDLAEIVRLDVDQDNRGTYNVEVSVGTQDTLSGDAGITWTAFQFPANGSPRSRFPRKVARYFAFRIETTAAGSAFRPSRLTAYFQPRGDR